MTHPNHEAQPGTSADNTHPNTILPYRSVLGRVRLWSSRYVRKPRQLMVVLVASVLCGWLCPYFGGLVLLAGLAWLGVSE